MLLGRSMQHAVYQAPRSCNPQPYLGFACWRPVEIGLGRRGWAMPQPWPPTDRSIPCYQCKITGWVGVGFAPFLPGCLKRAGGTEASPGNRVGFGGGFLGWGGRRPKRA